MRDVRDPLLFQRAFSVNCSKLPRRQDLLTCVSAGWSGFFQFPPPPLGASSISSSVDEMLDETPFRKAKLIGQPTLLTVGSFKDAEEGAQPIRQAGRTATVARGVGTINARRPFCRASLELDWLRRGRLVYQPSRRHHGPCYEPPQSDDPSSRLGCADAGACRPGVVKNLLLLGLIVRCLHYVQIGFGKDS
jgi:hypothetical protein